ncbi:MAG: tRNA-specific adenosine deaminase [Bacteroidetes bacterium GWA2_31_9]|nr:MAG: tRNA-specific adenosine deaminase [Bacteroidetes bacterium GWA2_31_9]
MLNDEFFMNEALKEAKIAFEKGEIPIGAVIVSNNQIIARAHNMTETLNDVTAHAEMMAFTSASNYLGSKYLNDCTLYVTIEPCTMCAGASYWTQIGKIVYGADDDKRGFSKINSQILHPKTELIKGVLKDKCAELIIQFFKSKRN